MSEIKKKAIVFPGQGSQAKGMGETLFDEFKEMAQHADEILGYSLKELCLENEHGFLDMTQYTQPALYTVSAMHYLHRVRKGSETFSYFAGHSLGEYNALFAAGAFDFATGLKLVAKRGELMGKANGGRMLAAVGVTAETLEGILKELELGEIDIANFNTREQTILSGRAEDIIRAEKLLNSYGKVRCIPLNVSGAFHSRYMQSAKEEFAELLDNVVFQSLKVPVISNFTARPYEYKDIKRNLAEQITGSVKWLESIRYLMGKEVTDIEQEGPGNVLANMVKKIQREEVPLIIEEEVKEIEEKEKEVKVKEETVKDWTLTDQTESGSGSDCIVLEKKHTLSARTLGNTKFREKYGLSYAYVAGGMYKGISSKEMVVKLAKGGMLSFLGTGGVETERMEADISYIKEQLSAGETYGVNLICQPSHPKAEEDIIDLYMKQGVRLVEASAFMSITPALVKYRLSGVKADNNGKLYIHNGVMAKVSRPELVELFLSPPPKAVVEKLLQEGKITPEEAGLANRLPMADSITIESDSGGHTDGGVAQVLLPSMIRLKKELEYKYRYETDIFLGAAGGIGTPEAVAMSFLLGVDYIVTGSINQCSQEAGTSDSVKSLLEVADVQDTEHVPAGDMFELGAKVQVLRKGLFFPARANKLYEIYRQYNSLEEIPDNLKKQLEDRYFKRTFEQVEAEASGYHKKDSRFVTEKNDKYKMAMLFKWYFKFATEAALNGQVEDKVDYQVHCGPAMGAFNRWVKGTSLESWKNRYVDELGIRLMEGGAVYLNKKLKN